jgi:transcriptional regulator with XRE-family HTH domain
MEPTKRFARNLRIERKAQSLSQERLALRARIHRTEISLLERGERDPRLSTIVRLARCLDVPPATLLDDLSERD